MDKIMVTLFFKLADKLAEECYKELSGSFHITSKIIKQQNKLSSNSHFVK